MGRDALARATLLQAATLKPPFAPVYRWLVVENWGKADWDDSQKAEACDALRDSARDQGDAALAAEIDGRSLFFAGDAAGAAKAFATAQSLGDQSPDLQLMYARAISKQGNEARAEQLLWKVVSDWPVFEDAYRELFGLYLQRRSQSQFVDVLRKWLEAIPTSVEARLIEVAFDSQNGGVQGVAAAKDVVLNLMAEQPESLEVLHAAEAFYRHYARLDDFIAQLEAERLRDPENREALDVLVTIYADQKRTEDATRVLEAARTAVAKDPDLLYYVAHLYERIERREVTVKLLQDIVAMDPRHAAASNDLGYTWADEGKNLDRAEELVGVAVPRRAGQPELLGQHGLGRIQARQIHRGARLPRPSHRPRQPPRPGRPRPPR